MECEHGEPRGPKACALCRYKANQLKVEGIETARTPHEDWMKLAVAKIFELARTGQPFTAEDVTDVIGLPGGSNKAVGSAFNQVAKTHMIKRVGERPASRPTSHRRSLAVWQGFKAHDELTLDV